MPTGYFSGPKPRAFGHRGAAGVAPENTLASFRRALDDGAEILELDVHATRDGEIVVIHDPTVDRTTNGRGRVRSKTLAELRKLDAGHRFAVARDHPFRGQGVTIPTLDEVLDAFPDTPLNIEIKQADPPIESAVIRLIEKKGRLGTVLLAAEDSWIMTCVRAAAPNAWFGFSAADASELYGKVLSGDLSDYEPPGHAVQIPPRFDDIDLVTPETVTTVHGLGLEMHVWTINDAPEMERLLALGVDGIMTDFPALLAEIVVRFRA